METQAESECSKVGTPVQIKTPLGFPRSIAKTVILFAWKFRFVWMKAGRNRLAEMETKKTFEERRQK
jgi:hypothetical protein